MRGFLDKLVGGPGLRRGRRDAEDLLVGDALDFWRVLDIRPCERLLLLAEMRLPGEALLEFRLEDTTAVDAGPPQVVLTLIARFLPRGLAGIVYWYAMYPFHQIIFNGMLRNVARAIGKDVVAGPRNTEDPNTATCKL